jgi:hypothetical protein
MFKNNDEIFDGIPPTNAAASGGDGDVVDCNDSASDIAAALTPSSTLTSSALTSVLNSLDLTPFSTSKKSSAAKPISEDDKKQIDNLFAAFKNANSSKEVDAVLELVNFIVTEDGNDERVIRTAALRYFLKQHCPTSEIYPATYEGRYDPKKAEGYNYNIFETSSKNNDKPVAFTTFSEAEKLIQKQDDYVIVRHPIFDEKLNPVANVYTKAAIIDGSLRGLADSDNHGLLNPQLFAAYLSRIIASGNLWLSLGDYVDRGKFSLETVIIMLSFYFKYKSKIKMFMLRGNHEFMRFLYEATWLPKDDNFTLIVKLLDNIFKEFLTYAFSVNKGNVGAAVHGAIPDELFLKARMKTIGASLFACVTGAGAIALKNSLFDGFFANGSPQWDEGEGNVSDQAQLEKAENGLLRSVMRGYLTRPQTLILLESLIFNPSGEDDANQEKKGSLIVLSGHSHTDFIHQIVAENGGSVRIFDTCESAQLYVNDSPKIAFQEGVVNSAIISIFSQKIFCRFSKDGVEIRRFKNLYDILDFASLSNTSTKTSLDNQSGNAQSSSSSSSSFSSSSSSNLQPISLSQSSQTLLSFTSCSTSNSETPSITFSVSSPVHSSRGLLSQELSYEQNILRLTKSCRGESAQILNQGLREDLFSSNLFGTR